MSNSVIVHSTTFLTVIYYSYVVRFARCTHIVLVFQLQVGLPSLLESSRYYITYNAERSGSSGREYFRPESSVGGADMRLSHALTSLTRDTVYNIRIRAEIRYSPCNSFVYGSFSDSVSFRTNTTSKSQKRKYKNIAASNFQSYYMCTNLL